MLDNYYMIGFFKMAVLLAFLSSTYANCQRSWTFNNKKKIKKLIEMWPTPTRTRSSNSNSNSEWDSGCAYYAPHCTLATRRFVSGSFRFHSLSLYSPNLTLTSHPHSLSFKLYLSSLCSLSSRAHSSFVGLGFSHCENREISIQIRRFSA